MCPCLGNYWSERSPHPLALSPRRGPFNVHISSVDMLTIINVVYLSICPIFFLKPYDLRGIILRQLISAVDLSEINHDNSAGINCHVTQCSLSLLPYAVFDHTHYLLEWSSLTRSYS